MFLKLKYPRYIGMLRALVKMHKSESASLQQGLRICIPNLLPGDADTAGPQTTLGVASISTPNLHPNNFWDLLSVSL